MKIIVTGSLGNVGKPLTKDLVAKGHQVTVITTKEDKKTAIEALGAEAAVGSLEDAGFLTNTFTGADAVFAMVPPNYTSERDPRVYYRRIASNYAKAIKDAGVKRIVQLSSVGADLNSGTGFILGSHDAEEILNSLDEVTITHLRPGYFYNNIYAFVDMIKHMGFIANNYGGDTKFPMVDPKDIAEVAAEELTKTTADEKIRYIAGEDITANEAARILGETIGKPGLQWKKTRDEEMQQGMEQNGMPGFIVANFVEMGNSIGAGKLRKDYDKHHIQPTAKIKLKDFAKDFAVAYKKGD